VTRLLYNYKIEIKKVYVYKDKERKTENEKRMPQLRTPYNSVAQQEKRLQVAPWLRLRGPAPPLRGRVAPVSCVPVPACANALAGKLLKIIECAGWTGAWALILQLRASAHGEGTAGSSNTYVPVPRDDERPRAADDYASGQRGERPAAAPRA
jgi:hypothetical protein